MTLNTSICSWKQLATDSMLCRRQTEMWSTAAEERSRVKEAESTGWVRYQGLSSLAVCWTALVGRDWHTSRREKLSKNKQESYRDAPRSSMLWQSAPGSGLIETLSGGEIKATIKARATRHAILFCYKITFIDIVCGPATLANSVISHVHLSAKNTSVLSSHLP